MAITQNTYTGDGSTVLFSFTFPYLETTDIKVSVNGVTTTAYTLANATTVQFNTAPANGAAIRIYRQTDDATLNAVFYPGSAIRSQDLNDNFVQNLYVTQEANNNVNTATTTANSALTAANTAVSTANTAVSTANTASSNASAAVSAANTASTNASTAVSTANAASSSATSAVNTANTASTNASAALTAANNAVTTANAATATANTASSNATAAVNTANSASTAASNAVSTANSASTAASNAVTTANTASSTATTAVSTANSALSTANAAASAVSNAILYDIVANVAAIPGTPVNNDAVEVTDSTGIQSFTPLAGVPVGFIGSPGLSVRIVYTSTGATWNWIQYFPNDPETRYLKLSGGVLTGQIQAHNSTSASTPGLSFNGDSDTGIGRPGANELALITAGTARITIDSAGAVTVPASLSVNGQTVVLNNDSRLTDTRTPADSSVTNAKIAANAITDDKISTTAAILGTKISPDFGNQNITTTGNISTTNQGAIRLGEAALNGSNSITLQAPAALTGDVTYTLPSSDGISGQYLSTSGSGTLSWTNPSAISQGNSSVQIIDTGSDGRFVVTTEGTERLRVDSSGRLGIGTTNPTSQLHLFSTTSGQTNSLIQFENGGTALVSGDELGRLDFISNDITTNANGSRVRIFADVTSTDGNGRLKIQTKAAASTTFTDRLTLTNTGVTVGNLTSSGTASVTGSLSSGGLFSPYLNNQDIAYGSVSMINTDTQIDVDLTSFLQAVNGYSSYIEFDVVGIYSDGAGTPTYSRLHKKWAQTVFWASTTWTIAGANLLGTAYNSDATNFPAGAVNAAKVLSVVSGSTFLLRFQNRTTPAAASSTKYEYNVRVLTTA